MQNKSLFKNAFIKTIPVFAGYIALGMGFGMILKSKGLGIGWSLIMSVTMYAGSMQYIGIDLITGGASFLTTAITTLMVNFRHLFYGISLIDKYKDAGKFKPYLMFALTDETYSLIAGEKHDVKKEDEGKYYFIISILNHSYWIMGCLLGTFIGGLLNINTKGMDFALTSIFVSIFVDQWESNKNHLAAILGLVISTICLLVLGPDKFLIPTTILITLSLILVRGREEKKYE